MVIGGHDDQVWASGRMAQNIAGKRAAFGLETPALIYPEAGHYLSGTSGSPTTPYHASPMKSSGTAEANAEAQGEA